MKIKRFVDSNMRQVLRRVREDQGPDAVILSNRRVENGIEVIAALDYDEALVQQALRPPASPARSIEQSAVGRKAAAGDVASSDKGKRKAKDAVRVVSADIRRADATQVAPAKDGEAPTRATINQQVSLNALRSEISNMRGMLETQLSSLSWRQQSNSFPMRAQVLRNLTKIGIAPDIANMVTDRIGTIDDAKQLWRKPLHMLATMIPVADDTLLRDGGVAALVGATGVGKTTTIAKIATRFAMQHGADKLALISTDAHRIGAQEHLSTFANILGVKVHSAEDDKELALILSKLRDKKLVLIDTEGTSQRDIDLTARLAAYGRNGENVRYFLTLAATCQEAGLDETIRVFNRVPLAGAIVTKVDEAAQLGCVLSALIRHDLSVTLLTDGQRIPDDLHLAAKKKLWLINHAVQCMRTSSAKVAEDTMADRFGYAGALHA